MISPVYLWECKAVIAIQVISSNSMCLSAFKAAGALEYIVFCVSPVVYALQFCETSNVPDEILSPLSASRQHERMSVVSSYKSRQIQAKE